jgi:MoxR-like ATPase
VLSDWQVSIPELATIRASTVPFVVLTSNNTRELSEALKRRCLFVPMDYPSIEREKQIILARVQGIEEQFAEQIARVVHSIRAIDLKKPPSVSETLDWARTLLLLGVGEVDADITRDTLALLLKYRQDIERTRSELVLEAR